MKTDTILFVENVCYQGSYKIDKCIDKQTNKYVYELVSIRSLIPINGGAPLYVNIHYGYFSTEKKARRKLKSLVSPNWFQKLIKKYKS